MDKGKTELLEMVQNISCMCQMYYEAETAQRPRARCLVC